MSVIMVPHALPNFHAPITLLSSIGLLHPTIKSNKLKTLKIANLFFIVCVLVAYALPHNYEVGRVLRLIIP